MPRFSSNYMVHNYYQEEAKKKTQEKDRNSKSSVMHSTGLQHTTNDHKQKLRSNNQITRSLPISKSSCVTSNVAPLVDHSRNSSSFSDSKHFVCSTCHKCVFNANHDTCINKLLKEVNSRKVKSHKTRNSNKLVDQKSHIQKTGRQIFTGHKFSPNKSSVVYEKIYPRSCLRWKPTGRTFDIVGLRWIPTGKLFDSCISKVNSEPPHGSNIDIHNIHECKQTLDSVVAEKADISKTSGFTNDEIVMTFDHNRSSLETQCQMMFEQNGSSLTPQRQKKFLKQIDSHDVNDRSSVVTTVDASDKRQQQPNSTSSTSTLATTVSADENFDL
ncbi:hypothetical protein Tco_0591225 [Tanacetum coccineum]